MKDTFSTTEANYRTAWPGLILALPIIAAVVWFSLGLVRDITGHTSIPFLWPYLGAWLALWALSALLSWIPAVLFLKLKVIRGSLNQEIAFWPSGFFTLLWCAVYVTFALSYSGERVLLICAGLLPLVLIPDHYRAMRRVLDDAPASLPDAAIALGASPGAAFNRALFPLLSRRDVLLPALGRASIPAGLLVSVFFLQGPGQILMTTGRGFPASMLMALPLLLALWLRPRPVVRFSDPLPRRRPAWMFPILSVGVVAVAALAETILLGSRSAGFIKYYLLGVVTGIPVLSLAFFFGAPFGMILAHSRGGGFDWVRGLLHRFAGLPLAAMILLGALAGNPGLPLPWNLLVGLFWILFPWVTLITWMKAAAIDDRALLTASGLGADTLPARFLWKAISRRIIGEFIRALGVWNAMIGFILLTGSLVAHEFSSPFTNIILLVLIGLVPLWLFAIAYRRLRYV
jgi:hypothetical protein